MKIWETARFALAALVGGVVVSFFLHPTAAEAGGRQDAKTVQAQRFELLDKDGKKRAVLATGEDGLPVLVMVDADGKARVTLAITKVESGLVVNDKEEKVRVALAYTEEGSAILALKDEKETPRVVIGKVKGETSVGVLDKDGKTRAVMGMSDDGEPEFVRYDKDGNKMK